MGSVTPNPKEPGPRGMRVAPWEAKQALDEEKPAAKGDRRRQLRVGEQSYDSILPMKVENRRASERSGHGIHWREGMNRSTYRRSATGTRL